MRPLTPVIIATLFAIALASCIPAPEQKKGPPDPSTYEEVNARTYFALKCNVAGKAINEWQSADGLWQYGQFVLKYTIDPTLSFEREREIDATIMKYFKVRTSDVEAIGALLRPPVEAAIQSVNEDRSITVDKGTADGLKAGYYAAAMKKLSDADRQALHSVMARYYYENIDDVVGMFQIIEAGEHTCRLKPLEFREGNTLRGVEIGAPVVFGFAPKRKYEILHMIPYAVGELPNLHAMTKSEAVSRLIDYLVTYYDGDKVTIDEMIALLSDNSPLTRQVVSAALKRITGMDFGYDPQANAAEIAQAARRAQEWWDKERSSFEGFSPKKESDKTPE